MSDHSVPFETRSLASGTRQSGLLLPHLYAIVNVESLRDVPGYVKALSEAGVELIQLRAKTLSKGELLELYRTCLDERDTAHDRGRQLRIIINDDPEIAAELGADGVHLGQEDLPVAIARRILGDDAIIGLSTHNVEQLKNAPTILLDYLALGPIFLSPTKQGHAELVGTKLLNEAAKLSKLPIVAIGGITTDNAKEVYAAGARSVAVISDLEKSKDLAATVADYGKALKQATSESRT